jgi:hypothetical protein
VHRILDCTAYEMEIKTPFILKKVQIMKIVHTKELDFPRNDDFDSHAIGEVYNAVTKISNETDDPNPFTLIIM